MSDRIARGRTADIYEWEPGTVLKLFHDWFELEDIQYEQRIAVAVHCSGIQTPAPGDLVRFEGRHALVYERVDGPDMFAAWRKQPKRLFDYARQLAQLHAQMHAAPLGGQALPALRPRLQRRIEKVQALPGGLKSSLLAQLERMPDGEHICHGDFHPGNVILTRQGAFVIDWVDACCGAELADVARTSVLLLGAAVQEPNPLVKIFLRLFHRTYLHQYFTLSAGKKPEYRRWLPLVAAARLSEGIRGLDAWLLSQASAGARAA